jgi:hypothetical protein
MTNAKDIEGMCVECQEYTTLHEPCCGAGVSCEGSVYDPDDYCEKCGEELESTGACEGCSA